MIGLNRRRGGAIPEIEYDIIEFVDSTVKSISVENWGGVTGGSTGIRGVEGEVTVQQAAAVTSFGTVFNGALTNSEDFKWFTGVTAFSTANMFGNYAGDTFYFPPNIKTVANNFLYNGSGSNNTNTSRIEIGAKVTSTGQWFCRYRTGIQTVVCYAVTPPTLGNYPFRRASAQDINSTFKIYVPDDSVDAYKAKSGWSRWSSRILPISDLT